MPCLGLLLLAAPFARADVHLTNDHVGTTMYVYVETDFHQQNWDGTQWVVTDDYFYNGYNIPYGESLDIDDYYN